MFSIGDFARHGLVSVRMLRHYDAVGLLRPAHVDPANGYRFYQADQLDALNRIVALTDLGFTLPQVRAVLDEQVGVEELRGMLRLRRAELELAVAADAARLTRVGARLAAIEKDGAMPADPVAIKRLPPVRVAELVAVAASHRPEDVGPVIQPLYPDLFARLAQAGLTPTGPAVAYYEAGPAGDDTIIVHAAVPVAAEPRPEYDFAIVDLPEVPAAAAVVHRGAMDGVVVTGQALAQWIDAHGYRAVGYPRELYLECPPEAPDRWVTELQEPIVSP